MVPQDTHDLTVDARPHLKPIDKAKFVMCLREGQQASSPGLLYSTELKITRWNTWINGSNYVLEADAFSQ